MTELELKGPARADAWKRGAFLLFAISLLAYLPAYKAGYIWDDPDYVLNNTTLRDLPGLVRMWTSIRSIPQWYPLVHTTFWVEYHLWGLWAPGYHTVNIVLHALGAVVLWRVLLRLGLQPRAALMGAALWSLHPVQVESVAWITERKNTLSFLLYMLSALCLLRWDDLLKEAEKQWKWWGGALVLFVLALFSKTVVASLPAAWLLIVWWKRGRITWADIWPTIPFFVLGAGLGQITAYLEKHSVGATGMEWAFTPADRVLIAGRAVIYYLWCLAWPFKLAFIYPRWKISTADLSQWIFPLVTLGMLLGLWATRKKIGRGPFVAIAFFIGTLFPALGFFNVFPHRYSFVADHFQHIASAGPLVLAAVWIARWPAVGRGVLLALLGILSILQCRIYKDAITLWTDTAQKSPQNWMVFTNLGLAYYDLDGGVTPRMVAMLQKASELAPDVAEAQMTLGIAYADPAVKRYAEARAVLEHAAKCDPAYVPARYFLGKEKLRAGDVEGALAEMQSAVTQQPGYANGHGGLGSVWIAKGNWPEAVREYAAALSLAPEKGEWQEGLGRALLHKALSESGADRAQHLRDGAVYLMEALKKDPGNARIKLDLARTALELGHREEAAKIARQAMAMDPSLTDEAEGLLRSGASTQP